MRNPPREVAKRFGSQSALANALGTHQTTVAYWVKTGRIPSKWHVEILDAAQQNGIELSPGDLVIAPNAPVSDPSDPLALYEGTLSFGPEGENKVRCYVLEDGRRIISRSSAVSALGGSGGDLESYVRPIGPRLRFAIADELVDFRLTGVDTKRVQGVTAESFMAICKAFVAARDDERLTTQRQIEMAKRCSAFISACATLGLIALIDEVTGYQYVRAEDALQLKLRAYIADEMREWEKTFPDELWLELGRLTNWDRPLQQRPKYWGKLVNELVYDYLDHDVFEWLKSNAPKPRHGQNYHQWLTSQYGLKKLLEHLWQLIGMASACSDLPELRYRMALKYGKQPVQIMMMLDPPAVPVDA